MAGTAFPTTGFTGATAALGRFGLLMFLVTGLAACGTPPSVALKKDETTALPRQEEPAARLTLQNYDQRPRPRIVSAEAPLQCVPYARELTGAPIRGDAWTWWSAAASLYSRGDRPNVGSVLVLKRTSRLKLGHLAVVTQILNEREIVVRHANWLNRGRIHLDTPVKDVSPGNDWSAVKVWYTPGQTYGRRRYPVQGFINTELQQALN